MYRDIFNNESLCETTPRRAYEGYLKKWIEPRWGEYRLLEIRAVEVESWLAMFNTALISHLAARVFQAYHEPPTNVEVRTGNGRG